MPRKKQTRRAAGEGTLRQRRDGRWEARIPLGGGKSKSVYGWTQKECLEKRDAFLEMKRRGVNLQAEKRTVSAYLRLEWLPSQDVAPATRRYYESCIRHIERYIGDILVADLTPTAVKRMQVELNKDGIADTTRRNLHVMLSGAFKQLVDQGDLSRNVVSMVKAPKVEEYVATILSDQAMQELARRAQERQSPMFPAVVLGSLGLRRNEALGLTWDRVNLNDGTIRIDRQLHRDDDNTPYLGRLKTPKSRRTISLPTDMIPVFRELYEQHQLQRRMMGSAWDDRFDLVVHTRFGGPYDNNFTRNFHRILGAVGLAPMRFHDLRHYCVSIMAAAGASTKMMMDWVGHSSPRMALHYAQVIQRERERTASAFEGRFVALKQEEE